MNDKILKLKNGGTLIYSKSKLNNCSAVEAGFRVGSYSESKAGVAHFCEHTLFKKTLKRSNSQIENDRTQIVFVNAMTSLDYLVVKFFRSNKLIEKSMEFAEDVLMNSIIDDEYLDSEKSVIKEELNMCLNSEKRDIHAINVKQSQSKAKLSSNILGDYDDISNIKLKDLLKFKKDYFNGNNFVISVASSLPLRKIKKLVNKYFVPNIPYVKDCKKPKSFYNDLDIDKDSSCLVVNNDQDVIKVLFAFKLNVSELELRNDINYSFLIKIFSGMQGDLFLKLRNKGLVYRCFADCSVYKNSSLLNIGFETSKEKIYDTIEVYSEEIKKLVNEDISESVIESFKNNMDYYDDEMMPSKMSYICHDNLMEYLHFGKLFYYTNKQSKKMKEALTVQNFKAKVNQIFNKNNKIYVTMLGNLKDEKMPEISYFEEKLLVSKEDIINGKY